MLLGFNSFFFTTTEARAQAGGGGGGNRAVTITATTNTPGIAVSGPIEEGFDEGVSAFLVEFTPTVLDDNPPPHASVSVTFTPENGWTLQQPDPINIPVQVQVSKGEKAVSVDWKAVLFIDGQPEDNASGKVKVVWPWAEFEVQLIETKERPGTVQHSPGMPGMFWMRIGLERTVSVAINVIPADLPDHVKDSEASSWYVGWVNNITSIGRTCYYPDVHEIVWWDTKQKPKMPIYDGANPALWYQDRHHLTSNGEMAELHFFDDPDTHWFWQMPPNDPDDHAATRALRALQVDAFRAWVVAARGEGDPNVINWLKWMNWSTDFRVDTVVANPKDPDPWTGMGFEIQVNSIVISDLFNGKGGFEPDIVAPPIGAISTREVKDNP